MRYEIEGDLLTDIADAIREKTGESRLYKPHAEMAEAIRSIETNQKPTGTINITLNGVIDVSNYATAVVGVIHGTRSPRGDFVGSYDYGDHLQYLSWDAEAVQVTT